MRRLTYMSLLKYPVNFDVTIIMLRCLFLQLDSEIRHDQA